MEHNWRRFFDLSLSFNYRVAAVAGAEVSSYGDSHRLLLTGSWRRISN